MRSALPRLASHPLGATLAGLVVFFLVFFFLARNVPMTIVAFSVVAFAMFISIRPEWGIYVLAFHALTSVSQYLPIPRVGPLSLPIALVGVLTLAFLVHLGFHRKPIYLNFGESWWLLAYTILILFSMFLAEHFGPNNLSQFRSRYLLLLVFFLLAINLLETPRAMFRMLWVLLLADITLVISALLNYVGVLEPIRADPLKLQGRIVGTIENPNALAFNLIGLLPFVLGMAIYTRALWGRVLLTVLVVANLFVILSTLSRGGFIALIAVMITVAFRVSKDPRLLVMLVLLGLITYLLLPAALFDRFEEVQSLRGNDRYVLTIIGMRMALDNPMLGVGFGNFQTMFAKYDVFNRGGSTAPHNLYTSIAAQTGIPSLIAYLTVLILAWRRLSRLLQGPKGKDRFTLLLVAALQANLVNVLIFGVSSHVEHEWVLFVSLALIIVLDRLTDLPTSVATRQDSAALPPRVSEASS